MQWAIEFAEEHPSALVLGVDLSPIQPPHVPVNCSFKGGQRGKRIGCWTRSTTLFIFEP